MGILSGLEQLGLGKLNSLNVFDEEKKTVKNDNANSKEAKKVVLKEEDYLFDKSYECPVCGYQFKVKAVRTGHIKLKTTDTDLRPVYENIDSLKYDAIVCPECGYSALGRYWKYVLSGQAKLIKTNISSNFSGVDTTLSKYSYDEAILRHKLALVNAVVKKAKNSEKAYICLKTAWLYRGKAESLSRDIKDYAPTVATLKKEEDELINNACDGFMAAYTKEDFPMCGMDEVTVTYLLAELCRRVKKYDECKRWVSRILATKAPERIKEKARTIKELAEKDQKNNEVVIE